MTNDNQIAEGAAPAVCQCRLPLSRQAITCVAGMLRAHLKAMGSRWRKLPPGRIAVIVLAHLRHDQRLADLACGNGVSARPSAAGCWRSSACSPAGRRACSAP